jgi:hypothetical protein
MVPVADPNNPTSLHRMAKGALIKALQAANPAIYDAVAVDKRVLTIAGIDPEGLFNTQPQPPAPPDPKMMAAQVKAQVDMHKTQIQAQLDREEMAFKKQQALVEAHGQQADRQSREKLEQMKIQLESSRDRTKMQLEHLKLIHEGIGDTLQMQSDHALAGAQAKQDQNQFALEQQAKSHEHAQKMEQQDRHFTMQQAAAAAKPEGNNASSASEGRQPGGAG